MTIQGRRIDPITREPIDVPGHEHYYRCRTCGGVVDKRDLDSVLAHEGDCPCPEGSAVQ